MKFRLRRLVAVLAVAVGLTVSVASPANARPPITPMHNITCTYTAKIPSVTGGKYISYGVKWSCNDYVDVRAVTIKLWRYSGATGYQDVAHISGTNTSPNFQFYALSPCSGANRGSYYYHTYYYVEAFHGNWGTNEGNSNSLLITCP